MKSHKNACEKKMMTINYFSWIIITSRGIVWYADTIPRIQMKCMNDGDATREYEWLRTLEWVLGKGI